MTRKSTITEQRRDDDFAGIMAGLNDAVGIAEGNADQSTYRLHVPAEIDVKAIRAREGLSQDAFAARYGFSPASIKQWEQKRRKPDPSARVLLTVIEREPEAVMRALAV